MNQLEQLHESGTTKNLVKKYKMTSQITHPFGEKKNKTAYCHHDDDNDNDDGDLCAKYRMIMERVDDDCLAEIFMYVPAWERPKNALVCKKWKRVLDDAWFNVKKLEFTHWHYDEYLHFLEENYPTIDGQFNFLKSLLYKCGRYLQELDLSLYDHSNILPIINEYCPNLEKLQIRIDYIDDIDRAIFNNAFTNLSKLKVLKIIFHDLFGVTWPSRRTALIESLLNVADTLTDLTISNWSRCLNETLTFPEEMTSVVPQLKALRKFVMFGIGCSKSLYDYLSNSKTIEAIRDDVGIIRTGINNMTPFMNIEVLNIINWPITDDGLYNIANTIERLHTLYISCSWLTDAGIVTCTKMNNLKILALCGSNSITDSSIKLLKNMRKLRVPSTNKITDESLIRVLENSPEMEWLCVINTGITLKFIEKAAEISRNRKRQLDVWVTPERDVFNTQVEYEYLTIACVKHSTTTK